MRRTTSVMLWLLLASTGTLAGDHVAIVQAYALIVGDAAVAAKRCGSIRVDWARLAVEGRRRAIGEQDFPVLRELAQQRIDTVDASLADEAGVREWCDDAIAGYGPGGMAVDGLLVP